MRPSAKPNITESSYRLDIQALRGIAVLQVIMYHADVGFPKSGFLGVDVFFVISGYLITRMISKELDAKTFLIARFYWRRAKRLLPATYFVLTVASLLSIFCLTQIEFYAFLYQLFGSLTFTSNFILMDQAGYFDVESQLKPLLHMWSLSLEEQFYFILPLGLVICPKKHRLKLISFTLLLSFSLCLVRVGNHPYSTFYMLPTRAWELLTGSLGAMVSPPTLFKRSERLLGVLAFAAIVILPFWRLDPIHPRLDAIIVCIATLAVLWTRVGILQNNILAIGLGKVGDISFSLYLIHWPLFALAKSVYLGELPLEVSVGLSMLSLFIAAMIYRFIENPVHRSNIQPTVRMITATCLVATLIMTIPTLRFALIPGEKDWAFIRRYNIGLDWVCDNSTQFLSDSRCRTSEYPKTAVWGDSFAMHLVRGLQSTDPGFGIVQVTRSECGPLLGVAAQIPDRSDGAPISCVKFNDAALAYLAAMPSVQYVVLSSLFDYYFDAQSLVFRDGRREPTSARRVAEIVGQTVLGLRIIGKKVIIVSPPPIANFNVGLCAERLKVGLWTINAPLDCSFPFGSNRDTNSKVMWLLKDIERSYDVPIIWLSDYLCERGNCKAFYQNTPIYRDEGHLTYVGSEALFGGFNLFDKVVHFAR